MTSRKTLWLEYRTLFKLGLSNFVCLYIFVKASFLLILKVKVKVTRSRFCMVAIQGKCLKLSNLVWICIIRASSTDFQCPGICQGNGLMIQDKLLKVEFMILYLHKGKLSMEGCRL